jgi:DNA-binding MarR family transcriptional regulator
LKAVWDGPAGGEKVVASEGEAQHFLELLRQTVRTIYRPLLWRKAAELELTRPQAQVLHYIEKHPGCYMGEVAKALDVSVSAITQIVDRLERRRYVIRGHDPSDRRTYTLELTLGGQDQVAALRVLQIESLKEVLSRMSARDRKHLIKGLEALVEATGYEELTDALAKGRRGAGEVAG